MKGNFGYIHLAIAAVIGLLLGLGAEQIGMPHPFESYDACMLRVMQGQPLQLVVNASEFCAAKKQTN